MEGSGHCADGLINVLMPDLSKGIKRRLKHVRDTRDVLLCYAGLEGGHHGSNEVIGHAVAVGGELRRKTVEIPLADVRLLGLCWMQAEGRRLGINRM